MYIGIPENCLSLTIIKSICANRTTISPVVVIPGGSIIEGWFHNNIMGHKLIIVSLTGYTNTEINLKWLDYFIKYNNCSPNKP